jgi:hypothetical protein
MVEMDARVVLAGWNVLWVMQYSRWGKIPGKRETNLLLRMTNAISN